MAEVIDYPDDPLRTLPTSDPYIRRVEFGGAGLITYLINDGTSVVTEAHPADADLLEREVGDRRLSCRASLTAAAPSSR
jgi:hypothetical protein